LQQRFIDLLLHVPLHVWRQAKQLSRRRREDAVIADAQARREKETADVRPCLPVDDLRVRLCAHRAAGKRA